MPGTKWGAPQNVNGQMWQYYIAKKFAFQPKFMGDRVVWLRFYWMTWPVDQNGNAVPLYNSFFADDPGEGPPAVARTLRETLLPCPFCGGICDGPDNYGDVGADGDNRDHHSRFVECRGCAATIYRHRNNAAQADAALIEAWNRRTISWDGAVR